MSRGHSKQVPERVKQGVCEALATAFGKSEFLIQWGGSEIPEMELIHGSIMVDGCRGVLLWATDMQTGILSLPKKPESTEMIFARVSVVPGNVM
jgi:hypothetical protein